MTETAVAPTAVEKAALKITEFRRQRLTEKFVNGVIMRIDKFLKVSRILKRRTLSKEACEKGKVCVNGREAKAGCQIKAGDVVELHFTGGAVKFRILQIKETVKKDEASSLYEIISEDAND